jgi:hypothetical protein
MTTLLFQPDLVEPQYCRIATVEALKPHFFDIPEVQVRTTRDNP